MNQAVKYSMAARASNKASAHSSSFAVIVPLAAPHSRIFGGPPAYSSLRHRFAGRQLQGGEDGRDGWGGRGPGGARPPRWRRRAHARAAAANVGTAQAG